ncbi:MAG: isoprenylcysteine carboxylmethyltransferase family protein [Ilumatobacter sp.]|nr:isoprenylcysteine carboxylmethyltransferase family protein [Ilumatobacter sp.]
MQRLLPPFLFLPLLALSIAIGLGLPVLGPWPWTIRLLGIPIAIGALWLNLGAAVRFTRNDVNIVTFLDPTDLVTDGRFAWTRNPMYLGFELMLAGTAFIVGTLTAWLGAIVFFVVADRWYIPFEERRLAAVFGERYDAYRQTVRRWCGRRTGGAAP